MPIYGTLVTIFWIVIIVVGIYKKIASTTEKDYSGRIIDTNPAKEVKSASTKDADFMTEANVTFQFHKLPNQYYLYNDAEILVNGKDRYILKNDTLTISLPKSFRLEFFVPSRRKNVFQVTDLISLRPGYKYTITFFARRFSFLKPRMEITENGLFEAF